MKQQKIKSYLSPKGSEKCQKDLSGSTFWPHPTDFYLVTPWPSGAGCSCSATSNTTTKDQPDNQTSQRGNFLD